MFVFYHRRKCCNRDKRDDMNIIWLWISIVIIAVGCSLITLCIMMIGDDEKTNEKFNDKFVHGYKKKRYL
jgi:hypothetical protein